MLSSGPVQAVSETVFSSRGSLEECFRTTDLEWRLAQIPDEAMCRGAFFNMLDMRAGSLSLATQHEYRRFFRIHRYIPFRMYPVRDYLTRMAVLAQIHWGAENIYSGIRTIQSGAFEAWTSTLVGRAALAITEPNFVSMVRFCERCLTTTAVINYGTFRVLSVEPGYLVTKFTNEYVYIEHAMVGALEGLSKLASTRATFETDLSDPFNGEVIIRVPTR